jgi:predicted PurR-regulated permease PerM
VPTIGPFVVVVPPSLYALLQFGSLNRFAVVFFGIGAIQFVIGNFVAPRIEGRALALSPLVILVAVIFWGWLWGVLGALLAVPLTAALVAVCARFERSEWVAAMLTE